MTSANWRSPTALVRHKRRTLKGTVGQCLPKKGLDELLGRDLSGLEAVVLMIDGVDFAGSTCVAALVVTADGTKVPVGLRQGDTENKTLVTAMLDAAASLREGLDDMFTVRRFGIDG
jgi:hypothetical protein